MNWNQPICEACWIEKHGVWIADAMTGDEQLSAIRQPTRLTEPPIERCAYCGKPTIFGTYVRANPNTVPYPAPDYEDAE